MANGDVARIDLDSWRYILLDGQSATSNGVWVEIPPQYPIRSFWSTTLEEGASDATIDIMVSNAETKPSDATDGVTTQQLTTATQAATKTETYRWVKAKKTQGTTPVATTVVVVAARS